MTQTAYHNFMVKVYAPDGKIFILREGECVNTISGGHEKIKKIYTKEGEQRLAFYVETENGKYLEFVGMPFVFETQEVEI